MKTKSIFGKLGMFLSLILLLLGSEVFGQVCTPNPIYTSDGIWPAAPDTMDNGCVGVPYGFTFTINVPTDTVLAGQSCTIDSIVVTNVTPLPSGLSYLCSPGNCHYDGGSSGCLQITGTPTAAGTTSGINITTNIYLTHPIFGPVIAPQTFGTYTIMIGDGPSTATSTTGSACGLSTGQASVIATPPGTYTYLWNPGGSTNDTIFNVSAGMYIVTVTDNLGCSSIDTATVTNPGAPTITSITITDPLCFGSNDGSATVSTTGGSGGNNYTWIPAGPNSPTDTNLVSGNYVVTVTDNSGCSTTSAFSLTDPPVLSGSTSSIPATCFSCNDGSASVTASGGTGAYTYSWAPSGGTASTAAGLGVGTYTVTVTDANGCTFTNTATITSPAGIDNEVTNSWSIYPNPTTDQVTIQIGNLPEVTTVTIYDLSGRQLSSKNIFGNLDKLDMSTLQKGTYLIQLNNGDLRRTFKVFKQ